MLDSVEESTVLRETFRGIENSAVTGATGTSKPEKSRAISPCCCMQMYPQQPPSHSGLQPKENIHTDGARELKYKREMITHGRKKVKVVMRYIEDLVRHYLKEVLTITTRKDQSNADHAGVWSAGGDLSSRNDIEESVVETEVIEAKAYFQKRSPNVLKAL